MSVCGIAPINNNKAEVIGVRTNEAQRNKGYAKVVCNYSMNTMANISKYLLGQPMKIILQVDHWQILLPLNYI